MNIKFPCWSNFWKLLSGNLSRIFLGQICSRLLSQNAISNFSLFHKPYFILCFHVDSWLIALQWLAGIGICDSFSFDVFEGSSKKGGTAHTSTQWYTGCNNWFTWPYFALRHPGTCGGSVVEGPFFPTMQKSFFFLVKWLNTHFTFVLTVVKWLDSPQSSWYFNYFNMLLLNIET